MNIKHNERGEVVSVNGLTTGHHIGAPMQDAMAEKPEDNQAYGEERRTVTRHKGENEELQPKPSAGGVSSWNDLTDKPFYEGTKVVNEPLNITWDGNTDGLVNVADYNLFKISDVVLTNEQAKTATITLSDGTYFPVSEVWDAMVSHGVITEDFAFFDVSAFVRKAGVEFNGAVFPEAGIYVICTDIYVSAITTTEPVEYTKTIVKKLDEKFLPDGVGGGGITGRSRIYGDRFDKYLYHDEDLTEMISALELDALMNSTGVLVLVPGEYSDRQLFPVYYRFNANIGCELGLWESGSVYSFKTKEATSGDGPS